MAATLIKIDRNGSKHFEGMVACDRCGGAGGSNAWLDTGWTCYKCGGTGKMFSKWIERTPEYEAKLAARRQAKQKAKMEELKASADAKNHEFFQKQGFNSEGKTYVVLGNTYEIKDQLKQLGCKFGNILGWHTDHPLDGYDTLEVDVNDCFYKDYAGIYRWNQWKDDCLSKRIEEANKQVKAKTFTSEHVGQIGDKIRIKATMTGFHYYKTKFGDVNIYTFTDIFKNVFVWKTSGYLEKVIDGLCKPVLKGDQVELIGTVKDHDEYEGIKQTILTRCKVIQ